jgi:hypothetical protein
VSVIVAASASLGLTVVRGFWWGLSALAAYQCTVRAANSPTFPFRRRM